MKKWCFIIVMGLLLVGCSSRFAYNNINWLVYWYLDDYVELNDAQEDVFDSNLAGWLRWHKSEELDRYITHLETLKKDIKAKALTEERVLWHLEQATQHWERMREELSPQLAEFALLLDDEQVISLFAALEEDNQEEEEELNEFRDLPEEERAEKRLEDIRSEIEENIGNLTDEQEKIIEAHSPLFLSTRADWLAYRRNIQNSARRLFVTRDSNAQFEQDLLALMLNPDDYRSEKYRINREANTQNYAQLIAQIAATLTPEQREKLIDEVDDLLSDLSALKKD